MNLSFPWSLVVVECRKRLGRTPQSSGSYWFYKYYPYTQNSVLSIRSYHSLQTVQKMVSDQKRAFCDNQYGSSTDTFFPLLHLTASLVYLLKDIDSV